MSLLSKLKKNYQLASQLRNEEKRIKKLDWDGLKKDLREYHNDLYRNQIFPDLITSIKTNDPEGYKNLAAALTDHKFVYVLEECSYGMIYLGWSIGVGLLDEQFPNEKKEIHTSWAFIKREHEELLLSKGIKTDFIFSSFAAVRQEMFDKGKEHGSKPEFSEFKPRRILQELQQN